MQNRSVFIVALALAAALTALPVAARAQTTDVARATLSNGLRVIVVRNALAPVVTMMLNYEVGSDEQWIPGLAHATEHMMFRGSRTLSSSQLMDSVGITGGDFDADTQSTVTQYFFTVPSQYLDIGLRAERSRATGLLMSQKLMESGTRRDYARGAAGQQRRHLSALRQNAVAPDRRDPVRKEHARDGRRLCEEREQPAAIELLPHLVSSQ